MTRTELPPHLTGQDVARLLGARHDAPFEVLGLHRQGRKAWVTALLPDAVALYAKIGRKSVELPRIEGALFGGPVPASKFPHSLRAVFQDGQEWAFDDPYRFGPVLGEVDAYLMGEGTHRRLWDALGAHLCQHEGVAGTHFAVWAPNAARVSVIGDFNQWDGRRHPMRRVGVTGVWELFIPGIGDGALYKYEIAPQHGGLLEKADPVGFGAQHPPQTASVVRDIAGYGWKDGDWMAGRAARNRRDRPISIYEVHLGSWRRKDGG
ncbi:MAG: GlgB N-terminal domain-containing protein, partial [Paracoccus sp. (in: a-proteobacteria)]